MTSDFPVDGIPEISEVFEKLQSLADEFSGDAEQYATGTASQLELLKKFFRIFCNKIGVPIPPFLNFSFYEKKSSAEKTSLPELVKIPKKARPIKLPFDGGL